MKKLVYVLAVIALILTVRQCMKWSAQQQHIENISVGNSKEELMINFSDEDIRSRRMEGDEEWITFNYKWDSEDRLKEIVTFHLVDDKVKNWSINDREEVVEEYLEEFASGSFKKSFPNIYKAMSNVLNKLPHDVFLTVTDRSRPVLFTLHYTTTIARFANSNEFVMREDDPPTFQEGFYFIKLADELNYAKDVKAIEGIIFHEIAHRVLEHISQGHLSCETEREANRLVKKWGFEREYKKASEAFGGKSKEDSACYEE